MTSCAVTCAYVSACGAPPTTGTLQLDESWSVALPPWLQVSRVQNDGRGGFVTWSSTSSTLARLRDKQWESVPLSDDAVRVIGVGFGRGDTLYAMVQASDRASSFYVYRVVALVGGVLAQTVEFRVPADLTQSVLIGGEWFFIGAPDSSSLSLFRLTPEGVVRKVRDVPVGDGPSDGPLNYSLTRDGSHLVLASTEPPFAVSRIDSSGAVVAVFSLYDDRQVRKTAGADRRAIWFGLPPVPLGPNVVYTLSDLQSDQRIIIVADGAGSVQSVRALNAPMGFVDGDVIRNQLCAIRIITGREFVCYDVRRLGE